MIAIDIPMPISCYECPCRGDESQVCNLLIDEDDFPVDVSEYACLFGNGEGRHPSCPLIEFHKEPVDYTINKLI